MLETLYNRALELSIGEPQQVESDDDDAKGSPL
jgi:hypothetical protein